MASRQLAIDVFVDVDVKGTRRMLKGSEGCKRGELVYVVYKDNIGREKERCGLWDGEGGWLGLVGNSNSPFARLCPPCLQAASNAPAIPPHCV